MKIYAIALAVFIFCGFNACIQEMGVFNTIYSHENSFETNVDTDAVDNLKYISGEDILSDQDMQNSNPDQGGVSSLLSGLGVLINILDKALNIDKLILEYTPLTAQATVQPLADFFATTMQIVYAAGLLSFYRKYQVG